MTARQWTAEELLNGTPRLRAQAEADARFDRNRSAEHAIKQYHAATRRTDSPPTGIGAPPPGDSTTRQWTWEQLANNKAVHGVAVMDASRGNRSAREALRTVRQISNGLHAATQTDQTQPPGSDAA